jgi:hypothetical protein
VGSVCSEAGHVHRSAAASMAGKACPRTVMAVRLHGVSPVIMATGPLGQFATVLAAKSARQPHRVAASVMFAVVRHHGTAMAGKSGVAMPLGPTTLGKAKCRRSMTVMVMETGKPRLVARTAKPWLSAPGHRRTVVAMRSLCETAPRAATRHGRTSRSVSPLAHHSGDAGPGVIAIISMPTGKGASPGFLWAAASATSSVAVVPLGFRRAGLVGL